MNNPILPPTWRRYKKVFLNQKENLSILRSLQYEMLKKARLGQKVLDFGGGDKAKYRHYLSCELYESINIDPKIQPTWTTKVGESFPSSANHYDTILSLNVFEHIYDVHFVFKEIYNSLKPGGNFIFSTPFLYPVHAHPDDYFRPTSSWILKSLSDTGFKNIEITPLVWGPFSSMLSCSGINRRIFTRMAPMFDLLYFHLRYLIKKERMHKCLTDCAMGYFVKSHKEGNP